MRGGIDEGLIFFDITMLVVRVGYKTPTGVARVELAYALEMLKRYPRRVRFIVALRRMVQVVPNAIARRYLMVTEMRWKGQQTKQSQAAIRKIADFLHGEASFFSPSAETLSTQSDKFLLAANMLVGGAINNLSPRGLGFFSNTPKQNVYVHVSGSRLPSIWIERWLARSPSISGVYLLHDIIPLTHPEYCQVNIPARHAKYVSRVLKSADVVIANSTFTAEALTGFALDKGFAPPNTVVAPLGISDVFKRRPPPAQSNIRPYFIFVSTIEPRKNHIMLLQVWSRLVARHGKDAPLLILVGRRGWENENVIDILERAHVANEHILECNELCDATLATLIGNARAALMPSHVEGYGLPVAEALSMGTPVICSDLDPFREIAGDVPEYVDPLAGRGWAKLIMQYAASDSPQRSAQLERIRSYKPPSWKTHFDIFGQVLDTLCADSEATKAPSTPELISAPLLALPATLN